MFETAPTVRTRFEEWIAEQVPPLVRPALARDYLRHFTDFTGYILPTLG